MTAAEVEVSLCQTQVGLSFPNQQKRNKILGSWLAVGLLVVLQTQQVLELLQLRVELWPGNEDKAGTEGSQGGDSQENLHGGGQPFTDNFPLAEQSLYTADQL